MAHCQLPTWQLDSYQELFPVHWERISAQSQCRSYLKKRIRTVMGDYSSYKSTCPSSIMCWRFSMMCCWWRERTGPSVRYMTLCYLSRQRSNNNRWVSSMVWTQGCPSTVSGQKMAVIKYDLSDSCKRQQSTTSCKFTFFHLIRWCGHLPDKEKLKLELFLKDLSWHHMKLVGGVFTSM